MGTTLWIVSGFLFSLAAEAHHQITQGHDVPLPGEQIEDLRAGLNQNCELCFSGALRA